MKHMGFASGLVLSALLSGLGTLVGCAGADGADGASALSRVVPEAAGRNCANGGQSFQIGADRNGSGVLESEEVTGTSYLCNGSSAKPEMSPIAVGDVRCPHGGTSFKAGADELTACNGAPGAAGATGPTGPQGDAGDAGAEGPQGPGSTELTLGMFLASQVVKGAVVTCTGTSSTATTASCTGMKVNGIDARLAAVEANAVCTTVTGKGYYSASGTGSAATPYLVWTGTAWSINTAGNVAPMNNVTCTR